MDGARRIASNHILLKLLFLGLAAACLLGPLRLPHEWPWLDGSERVWMSLLSGALILIAGVLVRFTFRPGLFVSPEGLTVKGMLRSGSMRWDEVSMVIPLPSSVGGWEWLALHAGHWGLSSAETGGSPRREFKLGRRLVVPSQFQASGLRAFLSELLQRVPPEVLHQNEAAHRWMRDQVEGSGSLLMKLI